VTTRILASASPGEVRIAAVRDGTLLDYAIWRPGAPDGVGDLHRGRVIARMPAMAGAFVALDGTDGFLPDSEGAAGRTEGDVVVVRVTRSAQGGKGPRLTTRLTPGERSGEITRSLGLLARGDGPLLEFAERYPDAAVLADDPALLARFRARLAARLSLCGKPIDDDTADQIETLARPAVDLPGGSRLHIHPTPALVAIDVDAGGAIGAGRARTAAHLTVNRSVIPVLARQIRLRNLSGAILVDFAGLPARRRAALGPTLAAALADDPLGPRLLGFTALGLAEIVRPRVHPPLHELLAGPHAAGLAALRQIAADYSAAPHRLPALRASPAVIAALEADAEALPDLARRAGRPLILHADPTLCAAEWVIEDRHE
jgi:Ribonuclease E/G family